MNACMESAQRCPRTGIRYGCVCPGCAPGEEPSSCAVFFLNGIGLGHKEYRDALQSLDHPMVLAHYPYPKALHIALTVPGFEDASERLGEPLLTIRDQAARVAEFMQAFLAERAVHKIVLYGFSFGSDLAVDLLELLPGSFPLDRVLLAEMNVHLHSCFITSRIAQAYEAAQGRGEERHREAHKGFVSRVVKAHAEGRLSLQVMEDMAHYCKSIGNKDWRQLAQTAREVLADPGARVERLLDLAERRPGTRFELVFSDPEDLRAMQQRMNRRPGCRLQVFDASPRQHFHHMGRFGIQENLGGGVREAVGV